jgi:hypothetical protein
MREEIPMNETASIASEGTPKQASRWSTRSRKREPNDFAPRAGISTASMVR